MNRNNEGSLTIEATIALSAFLFFLMFMANFGHIYSAQNFMTHSLAQAGQLIAFSSYAYSKEGMIPSGAEIVEDLMMFAGVPVDGIVLKNGWKSKDYAGDVSHAAFNYCTGGSEDASNKALEKYGIETLTFDGTTVADDDIKLRASYKIRIPFAFFGIEYITMHQQIACRLWE